MTDYIVRDSDLATSLTETLATAATAANAYADSGDAATLAAAKEYVDQRSTLQWDDDAGEYTTDSIRAMLASRKDGLAYGVSIPKGSATACTKLGSNAGIATPTPGVVGTPASDPYTLAGPFFFIEVNATVDTAGAPHVTGIQGDGRFARDGSNGDVFILTPVLYWSWAESDSDVQLFVSDTQLSGMSPQPKAKLPSGGLRPFMLFAKYPLSVDASGNPRSVSGTAVTTRTISHNSLITLFKTATTGYSGKSYADDWYVKVMFLLKYATKNSQQYFAGVTSWDIQTPITVAESGTSRVIIATSVAANIPIGSTICLGTTTTSGRDRNNADTYDIFAPAKVTAKTTYDSSNTAITVAAGTSFSTTVGQYVSTMPWHTGACDSVTGDGSPYNPLSGREPFTIQGIEMMHGAYEVLGDVILKSDGSTGWQIYTNINSKNESTSVTSNYTATGKYGMTGDADGNGYPYYPDVAGGLLFGAGKGASTSTGMCDITYYSGQSVSGTRQWRSLGYLGNGGMAGLWYVNAYGALSDATWHFGSRLSAIGRSAG